MAISASPARANPCEISSWATSAAQDSKNAAPRMAIPVSTVVGTSPGCAPSSLTTSQGAGNASAPSNRSTGPQARGAATGDDTVDCMIHVLLGDEARAADKQKDLCSNHVDAS